MRLTELMRMQVIDGAGEPLDHVEDVVLEQRDGHWVVMEIILGRTVFAERLGFMQGVVRRPMLLARFVERVARHARVVPWETAKIRGDGVVEVAAHRVELERPRAYR